jgi:hypothetical protein
VDAAGAAVHACVLKRQECAVTGSSIVQGCTRLQGSCLIWSLVALLQHVVLTLVSSARCSLHHHHCFFVVTWGSGILRITIAYLLLVQALPAVLASL